MNTSVIIMADGLGSRWESNQAPVEYKQLLLMNGIPLIVRTINQVKSYKPDEITLICPDSFMDIPGIDVPTTTLGYRDYETRPLLDGILRTQHLWSEKTIILLGDVCFSNHALSMVLDILGGYYLLGRKGSNKVTGKQAGELFALTFLEYSQDTLIDSLQDILYSGETKLWGLYKYYPISIYEPCDYTDDCDSPQSYVQHWNKLEQAAIKDDKNEFMG